MHFAVYWDAKGPLEHVIDCLCKYNMADLKVSDINAMLQLPGAVQIVPALQKGVEDACTRWLQHAFGDQVATLLGNEQLKAEFCKLSLPAIKLYVCSIRSQPRASVVHALVLWCVHPTNAACLGKEALELFTAEDTAHMLSLPLDLGARGVCIKWLLHYFRDVHYIVITDSFHSSFLRLPFPAVLLWAGLDDLMVLHSENEVAALLAWWANANKGKVQASQLRELSTMLRVCNMSQPFRKFQLPKLGFFNETLPLSTLNLMLDMEEGVQANGLPDFPSAWLAPPRQLAVPRPEHHNVWKSFSRQELESLLSRASTSGRTVYCYSDAFQMGGYAFRFCLQLQIPERSLGLFLHTTSKPPIPGPFYVKACYSLTMKRADGTVEDVLKHTEAYIGFDDGWGLPKVVDNVESMAQLKEYLLEEQLHVGCKIVSVQ